ncbi:MAG: L-threonylcarbamoyladenylate synthase [Eubacteriales bacterium]|nr:L-threonylcarbamoyladenylate synthase [Eubacteriales bacterium]
MNTILVKAEEKDAILKAGEILRRGGLTAFPTETVYGLGANALDEKAAAKIYAAKGRPSDNPLIVHIARFEDLEAIAAEIPESARLLAKRFWPGPLTMIFRKTEKVPYGTTGGLDTVAVRMPSHPVALALIEAGGGYIAAPSANTSGKPSPTTAAHVAADMDGRIDLILDGGPSGIGLESTIVDVSGPVPVILRPGYINQAMLEEVVGEVQIDQALIRDDSTVRPKAPGMKYKHYAPKADLKIVEGPQEAVVREINRLIGEKTLQGEKVGVIATEETKELYQEGLVKSIGRRMDEESIGRHLYSVLREFDESEVSQIYSEAFETPKMGQAIMNRLVKAAGHQIIKV